MTKRLREAIAASFKLREKLNGLPDDAPADAREPIEKELREADAEVIKATEAEPETRTPTDTDADPLEIDAGPDALSAEERERREIRSRAAVTRFVDAAVARQPLTGAEAEYAAAMGVAGQMPVTMLFGPPPPPETRSPETRASATVAAAAVAENPDPTAPQVFLSPLAAALGVMTPTVPAGKKSYPYISTGTSPAAVAKGTPVGDSSPAIAAMTASPGRIAARFQFQREDQAMLGDLDSALTGNLQDALREEFEKQIIAGDNAGPNLNGLLHQRAPAAIGDNALTTLATLVAGTSPFVDGRLAESFEQVSILTSPAVAHYLKGQLVPNTMDSSYDWLVRTFGGVRISGHVPTVAAVNHGTAGNRRAGGGGLWGIRRRVSGLAYAPIWMGVDLVRDEITGASSGTVHVTAYLLAGGVALVRPDVYEPFTVRTVAGAAA